MPRKNVSRAKTGQVRIIAGQCRGRRITFPSIAGLRPTGDRLRETLFNWLSADIAGARCLDLFAGSGALGLEAASRGAEHVILLESNDSAARALRDNIKQLALQSIQVFTGDALNWLQQHSSHLEPFDIIFLDPPFHSTLLTDVVTTLTKHMGLLETDALIYIESPTRQALDFIPDSWELYRHKTAGDVSCYLYHATRSPSPERQN